MVAFDLSDALLAPEFVDGFVAIRRVQAVDTYGRAQNKVAWTLPARGVVTPASPNQLARLPEQQHARKSIEIVTPFSLHGPSEGGCPDVVHWNGDSYIVQTLDDWSHYGPGFVHVVCTSMDSVDAPPLTPLAGQS